MSNSDDNKFRLSKYEYEDISDEIIDMLVPFYEGQTVVTDREKTDLDIRIKYLKLYNEGFLDRRIDKYDLGRTILMTWSFGERGVSLFNSKRMIAYNREKTIDDILG